MAARPSIVSMASTVRSLGCRLGGRRGIQGSSHQDQAAGDVVDKVKHGADEAMKRGQNLKNAAAEKMGGAWGNAKDTAEKATDTVKETKEAIKSQAEKVEKCMNTKKEVS